MTYTASWGFGPGSTPKIIRYLIITSCVVSILCAFVNVFFVSFSEGFKNIFYLSWSDIFQGRLGAPMRGPQALLSLSWTGMQEGYVWQPITYLFVQANGEQGLSLIFLVELFFNMYFLWIMGSYIAESCGAISFTTFYLAAGAFSGLLALFLMPLLGQYMVLAGPSGALLALLTVWAMIHPESEINLFHLTFLKAKWLCLGIVSIILLINISHLNLIYAAFVCFSVLFGYLYGTVVWQLHSPFAGMRLFDQLLIGIGRKVRSFLTSKKSAAFSDDKREKIIDFHTGKSLLDDDLFMDQALEKISKYGEQSLSWSERNRMRKISERKARHKGE